MEDRIYYECDGCGANFVITIIDSDKDHIDYCPFCCDVLEQDTNVDV